AGPGYPPLEAAAPGHADVAEAAVEPSEDLIAPRFRDREFRIVRVQVAERLLVLRETEEEVLFLHALDLARRMVRALTIDEVRLVVERLATDAVIPLVRPGIHIAVRDPAPHELLHALL